MLVTTNNIVIITIFYLGNKVDSVREAAGARCTATKLWNEHSQLISKNIAIGGIVHGNSVKLQHKSIRLWIKLLLSIHVSHLFLKPEPLQTICGDLSKVFSSVSLGKSMWHQINSNIYSRPSCNLPNKF